MGKSSVHAECMTEENVNSIIDSNQKSPKNRLEKTEIVIEPRSKWFSLGLKEVWAYRELLYFLVWRDIKVRYKQTVLGVAWAILQPVMTMVIFSFIFGSLANLPSDGIPYPIFTYTALLPWQLFSSSLSQSTSSLVTSKNLITKIYFPRLVIPVASPLSSLVDFFISLVVLVGLMIFYKIELTPRILFLPFMIAFAILASLSVSLWLSSLNVRYRDIQHTIPFIIQFWQYATPIAYSISIIPEQWRTLYGLNPMVGVVEGFRWALLGKTVDLGFPFYMSILIVVILFIGGLVSFKKMEDTFADII
jgi:lipopolysaccharide transport system permease protein